MPEKMIHLNGEVIMGEIKELIRGSVEEPLNELLEVEAKKLTQTARYERSEQRQGDRGGHYSWNFTTTSGDVTLKVLRLKGVTFENAIIERNRLLQGGKYPYIYVDGIYLCRNWGGEYENVAILVAIAVNGDGYRKVLGVAEGMKGNKANWVNFFQWLWGRGLNGVKLIVGDK